MNIEVWLPAYGFEDYYEVSNLGRVRRATYSRPASGTHPGKILQPAMGPLGYMTVCLSADGQSYTKRLHKLVLQTFCGSEPFEGAHVCHNDGNPTNCVLRNLRWDSAYGNQADVVRHGKRCQGEDVHNSKLTESQVRKIRNRLSLGERNKPIAEDFSISISTVHLIRHNKIWKHLT